MIKRTFDLGLLSKHRNFLYGIATILIVWCHLIVDLPDTGLYPVFTWVQQRGMVGVEMFLMLSGFGLYGSLSRNPDIWGFYKRRMLRVLLPTFIVTVTVGAIVDGSLVDYVKYITIIPGFFSEMGFWYPAFIVMMYAIYPLIFKLQKRSQITFIFMSVLISIACIGACVVFDMSAFYERAICRVPAFLVGCAIAPYVLEKRKVSAWVILAAAIVFVAFDAFRIIFVYNGHAVRALAFVGLSVVLVWMFACIGEYLSKGNIRRGFYRLGVFLGMSSLETYIVHTKVRDLLEREFLNEASTLSEVLKVDLSAVITAVFIAYLLTLFTSRLIGDFNKLHIPSEERGNEGFQEGKC